jgi:hypothetical protein
MTATYDEEAVRAMKSITLQRAPRFFVESQRADFDPRSMAI